MSPETIFNIRTTLGLSQAAFAARLGLKTKGAVSHLEDGRREPTPPVVLLLRGLAKEAEKKSRKSAGKG